MMVTDPQRQSVGKMSVASYLVLDDNSAEARYEYLDGQVYALAGGTSDHDYIAGNMYIMLREQLGNKTPCRAYTSDKRVKLAEQYYVYPDGVVSCDVADHGQSITILSPHLVVEVLSPSTERADHTKKLPAYQACLSIQEIVFIRQDVQFVEVYHRSEAGARWNVQYYHTGETIILESVDITMTVASLYEGLNIPKEEGD